MTSGFWKPVNSKPVHYSIVSSVVQEGGARDDDDVASNACYHRNHNVAVAQQRMLLPIYKHKRQIVYAVETHGCVVIVGATGSGKSTQLPQYLLEAGWADNGFEIVCTQPRRVAATSLAHRVAEEMGEPSCNRLVGYTVRFDDQTTHGITKIKYVTEGIILREATLEDPLLSRYSVIICDEAHERNLNTDVLLGLLKKIRQKRKDLRIIICSATIDAQAFLDFFVEGQTNTTSTLQRLGEEQRNRKRSRWGGMADAKRSCSKYDSTDRGTIISVDGRQYEVETFYAQRAFPNYLQGTVETCWKIHHKEAFGGVLCFLPTSEDVDAAIRLAEEIFKDELHSVEFLPMYGSLPQYLQARIFDRHSMLSTGTKAQKKQNRIAQRRRFIFATNIAETSITVPNICFVVDSGLVKLPFYDPVTAMERLIVGPISQASARQRAGRAGRIAAGKCFRLYTETFYSEKMKSQTLPEIVRTNLTSLVLTLKALGVDNVLAFHFIDIPSIDAIAHALESLYALGAIDFKTKLTSIGMDLSSFPTEPRVSRMLLESISEGCAWEVLAVASALQVRDLFQRPNRNNTRNHQKLIDYQESISEFADPSGDHVTYANLLSEAEDRQWSAEECREMFVDHVALLRACEIRRQLARFLRKFGAVNAMGITDGDGNMRSRAIRRCVTAGFFFNVAKLSPDGRYHTLRKDILVTPSASSVFSTHGGLMSTEYIIFGETVDGSRGGIELKSVSTVEAKWLREIAPHYWEP